jgi:uncharacterized protein YrrD
MRKGKDLLGLSIVGEQDGCILGTVRDLLFDHDTDQLLAFVLAESGLFGLVDAQIVPWPQVRNIAGDVILVRNEASRRDLHDAPQLLSVARRETVLSGTQVLSHEGRQLGTLADMFIDEASGRVVGYEVSGGFIADTLHGKRFLSAPPGLSIGTDAAIANADAVSRLDA